MTLRVLIADDEALARARLRRLLGECRQPDAVPAAEAADAVGVMARLAHERFDVILLDIRLPGQDGLDLARALRERPEAPEVIFVTAYAEHAVTAFALDAVDYLTKPVRLERLQDALRKVGRRRALGGVAPVRSDDALVVTAPGLVRRVRVADIVWLQAEAKYVTVYTASAQHVFDGSLTQVEERYPHRFLRVHRSALVARAAVEALELARDAGGAEGWVVRLRGAPDVVPVSRRPLSVVRAALAL